MNLGGIFIEAIMVAFGGALAAGIIAIIRLLSSISRDMKCVVPSVRTLYEIQPCLTNAIRHQNAAFKELGANGSTIKSDECLDEVDRILVSKLANNSIGKV